MKAFIVQKKIMIAVISIAAILFIGAGAGYYYYAPSNVLAIDVNPSIELKTNRLNKVVAINPENQDAVNLMAGYQLEDSDLDTVIGDIVDRLIFFGYLTSDQKNQILISADDTYTSVELLDKVNVAIADYMAARQLEVEVLRQQISVSDEGQALAHDNNVSFGKMAIIDKLIADGSDMSAQELADDSVKQLIAYAIDHNISLEELIDNYNEIAAAQASEDAAIPSKPVTSIVIGDTPDENEAFYEDSEDADEDSNNALEDADDQGEDKAGSKEDADFEDANDASDEDSDSAFEDADDQDEDNDKEDADFEDANENSDEDSDSAFEDADDQGEDNNKEDAYYEDNDKEDSDNQDSYEMTTGNDDSDEGDREDSNYSENDNHRGDNDNQGNDDDED